MKRISILLVLIITYNGCESSVEPPKESIAGLTIKGKIFEYDVQYKYIGCGIGYSYEIVDSAFIDNAGEFNLFIKDPDQSLLWHYYKQEGIRGRIMDYDSVYFSNPSFKYIPYNFIIKKSDGSGMLIDKAKKTEVFAFPKIGEYFVKYYYTNDTTTVNGKHIVEFLDEDFKYITTYNIKFENGWNQLSYKLVQKNDSTEVYQATNADTTLNNWVILAGSFFSNWQL